MDKKNSNIKWIASAMVLVATVIGVYYIYFNQRKEKHSNKKEKVNLKQTSHDTIIKEKIVDHSDEKFSEESKCKKSLQEQRDAAIIIKKKGNEFFNNEDYENAIEQYESAIATCPLQFNQEHAVFYQNKAAALRRLQKLDEALSEANKALEFSPRYKTALITRSKIFETQGKYQEALYDIAAAVTFDSSDKSDSITLMDNIIKNIAMKAVEKELMNEPILPSDFDIKIYFESFQNDPLLKIMNSGFVESGNNQLKSAFRCIELLNSGYYFDSFEVVQEVLQVKDELNDTVLSQLYLLRGTFYLLSCREDLALKDFAQVIENPESKPLEKINAIIKRATIILTENNSLDIEEIFNEALKIKPDCPDIFYHRGLSYENSEQRQAAIDDYQKALYLDPGYVFAAVRSIFNEYMLLDTNQEDYFIKFKNLMHQFPNCIEVQMIFVKVLLDADEIKEAEQISENMLLLQPNSGFVMSMIAKIKSCQQKVSKAIEILNKAIEKDPKHAESYHSLAAIYIRNGELEKAIELLETAIKFAKNRKVMRDYIELREGILAQLNVSKAFDIPIKDVMYQMSQGEI